MFTAILLCLLCALIIIFKKRSPRLPPGPWGVPILGYLPFIDRIDPTKTFKYLVDKYGDIYCLRIGEKDVVIISDHVLLKEAFSKPELNGRLDNELTLSITFGKPMGFVNSTIGVCMEHRRFARHHLKDLGMGKREFEPIIMKCINKIVSHLREEVGKPEVTLGPYLETTVVSAIWGIVLGHSFRIDDQLVYAMMKDKNKAIESYWKAFLVGTMNKMVSRNVPRALYEYDEMMASSNFFKLYASLYCEYFEKEGYHTNPTNYAQYFLQKKHEDEAMGIDTVFTDEDLVCCLMDIFIAGSETVSSLMRFCILYLILHQDWQAKLQGEVDKVIGTERQPCMEDKAKMPIMDAFINETFRTASIALMGLYHIAYEDVEFHGFDIPKGTVLLGSLDYIHRNPANFENPEEFNPGRFLDEEGNMIKNPALIPFSVGKRNCIGEHMTRMEAFLFLSTMVQNFTFKVSPGKEPPSDRRIPAFVVKPLPFTMCVESRNNNLSSFKEAS